jgi:pimeloyl-ACP methyl ester carboxylesterase
LKIASCGERGIRTPGPLTVNGFQDRRIKPLCHLSAAKIQSQGFHPKKNQNRTYFCPMILRRRYVLPFLFVMLWIGCRNCRVLELRMNDKDIQETLSSLKYPYQIIRQKIGNRNIRYLKVGADSLPKLIFLHGSPSSLSAWRTIYTDTNYLKHFQMVAIDRPGYGFSDFGSVETDLQQQVSTIQVIVDSMTRHQKAILFGSSYGGAVAVQLAMNLPDRISQLVLLSAALKPGSETTYWVSYPMTIPIVKYLFPPTFVMSSEEKLAHQQQLETLVHWEKIRANVLLIHGDKDGLVYFENALFAKQKMINAKSSTLITMKGKGHSVIFSQPNYVKAILARYLLGMK